MKAIFYLFLFLTSFIAVNAQKAASARSGVITGKVVDAATKSPIEYATITVYPIGSSKPVNGIITNAK